MSKKALALAVLTIGTTLSLTGIAHAEPNADPAKFADFTTEFVNGLDPAAAANAKA